MIIVYQSLNSGNQTKENKLKISAIKSGFTEKAHMSMPKKLRMLNANSPASPSSSFGGTHYNAKPVRQNSNGTLTKLSSAPTPHHAGIEDNQTLLDKVIQQIEIEVAVSYESKIGIIVLGEIYLEKNTPVGNHYSVLHSINNRKACQSFTVLINLNLARTLCPLIKIENSKSHPQFPILTYNQFCIGFVHIPNKYADNTLYTTNFLALDAKGIHLFIGDTNFRSENNLREVCSGIWNTSSPTIFPPERANSSTLHPGHQGKGTNSTQEHLYDRGFSRIFGSHFSQSTVDWSKNVQGPQPAFQFLGILGKCFRADNNTAVPFSDHNGLVISVIDQ